MWVGGGGGVGGGNCKNNHIVPAMVLYSKTVNTI